jgi:hypothetical protein
MLKIILALALAGRGAHAGICGVIDTKAKCNRCDSCDTDWIYCELAGEICEWADTPECNPVLSGGNRKLKFGASEDPEDPGLNRLCCNTVTTCA